MGKSDLRLRELCREKGITQADLANRLGIRRDSFSQAISRNNLDMEYLRRIANALDVELWQLFKAEDEDKKGSAQSPIVCPYCGKPIDVSLKTKK